MQKVERRREERKKGKKKKGLEMDEKKEKAKIRVYTRTRRAPEELNKMSELAPERGHEAVIVAFKQRHARATTAGAAGDECLVQTTE